MVYCFLLNVLLVLRREKRVLFLWVCFNEKLCLPVRHCYRLLSLRVRPWQVARQSGMWCFRGKWFLTLWRGGCAFIFRWAVEGRRRAAPVPAKQCTGQMCGQPHIWKMLRLRRAFSRLAAAPSAHINPKRPTFPPQNINQKPTNYPLYQLPLQSIN